MCEMREGVFTQLAKAINNFSNHKFNKEQLYNIVVGLIEIADESEKNDRNDYEKFWEENSNMILPANEIPYSNWKDGLDILNK